MQTVIINFRGRVQGVGFRNYTYRTALKFGCVYGYVKNNSDGSVILEMIGDREKVLSVMKRVEDRFDDNIEEMDIKWLDEKKDYKTFEIKYD